MTEHRWRKYKREHPYAKRENHTIIKSKGGKSKTPSHIVLTKAQLSDTLTKGHYSIVSAGRNPSDPKEGKLSPSDPFFRKRYKQLRHDLEEMGLPYSEVIGHYGGQETSYMVFHDRDEQDSDNANSFMVHARKDEVKRMKKMVAKLGKKYNQDSVLFGDRGANRIMFTTGKHKGKECGGEGWEETPKASDFFTEFGKGRDHTKFSVNVDDCFEQGYF